MTDPIERARRALLLKEEFIDPIMGGIRQEYADRIVEVASSELDPVQRERKLTALSVAMRIADNFQQGLLAVIQDGELAHKQLLRAEKVERMSAPQRKLFNVVPY